MTPHTHPMDWIVVHPACHSDCAPTQLDLYVSGRRVSSQEFQLAAEEVVTELFKGGTALRALVHTRSVLHPTLAPPGTFRAKGCTPID